MKMNSKNKMKGKTKINEIQYYFETREIKLKLQLKLKWEGGRKTKIYSIIDILNKPTGDLRFDFMHACMLHAY